MTKFTHNGKHYDRNPAGQWFIVGTPGWREATEEEVEFATAMSDFADGHRKKGISRGPRTRDAATHPDDWMCEQCASYKTWSGGCVVCGTAKNEDWELRDPEPESGTMT
jgi:hypothetical protein